jgi:hypothetical protein
MNNKEYDALLFIKKMKMLAELASAAIVVS